MLLQERNSPPHIAICVDKARLLQFVESGALDATRLQDIFARHGLFEAWKRFERQFLSDAP